MHTRRLPISTGVPQNVQVRDLQYDPTDDVLAAATYGLGLLEIHPLGTTLLPTRRSRAMHACSTSSG